MALNSARLKTFLNVPTDLRQWTAYLQQALEQFASTLTTSDITDITAAGSALTTAADLNAQKTLLGISTATLDSGTYTPTLANVTNVAASTAYACQYLRVGNTVTVSGRVDVDPTIAGATELGISLPIASDLAALEECAGVAFASGIAGQGAVIVGDAANDRASMRWVAVDFTNQPMYFTFSYHAPTGAGGGATGDTVTYTTGTSVTETVPAGKTSVVIKVWGGGASGAGYYNFGYGAFLGGGGGGGAYSEKTIAVVAGNTLSVTVGAQVLGVSGAADGVAGNASSVTGTVSGGAVSMSAGGGAKGVLSGAGGVGGTASGGDTNTSGTDGTASGGAGGAGASGGAGGTANGGNGSVQGGGGGGRSTDGTSGNGARGQVSFTYT